jgi:hypothetical protein
MYQVKVQLKYVKLKIYKSKQYIIYIHIIMFIENETTKYLPVDIKSDLFITVHQRAYLNNNLLSNIFSIII